MQTRIAWRLPSYRWANHETMGRIAACIFAGEIAILHFYPRFEAFVFEPDRNQGTLRKAPFSPTIASNFLFEKPIHCPFDPLAEIFRQQKSEFIRVRHFEFSFRLHVTLLAGVLKVE